MGKGVFLAKKCSECNGKGGKMISCTQEARERFDQKKNVLSEQEVAIFENYSKGFSQDEIAAGMDMPPNKVINILYAIEQKLNK
ncbi:MAG: sigma-70 family RNA polymerase sigma factor [Candidatus Omnitrophica bacterium]|nr:sigma-70 family RNA polymerase sigma factor [Candidatus Omnitrophota bacterium]